LSWRLGSPKVKEPASVKGLFTAPCLVEVEKMREQTEESEEKG
jgi:hypothetical protein